MFSNDDNYRRKATARHVEIMAETNVSAYFASKSRIGTGKVLTRKRICTLLLFTKHTDSILLR
jgi:hypothetical protein